MARTPNLNAGKKVVPTGYKNYGQYRSQYVRARNAARKSAAGPTPAVSPTATSATTALKAEQRAATLKAAEQQATTKNALAQKAGYRNYGQQRSEFVHKRNAARKATKLTTIEGRRYKRGGKAKPRFGNNEQVNTGTAQRTMSRLRRLGANKPGGGYGADIYKGGITGGEARKVKTLLARKRGRLTSGPRPVGKY